MYNNINAERARRNMTVEDLAKEIGINLTRCQFCIVRCVHQLTNFTKWLAL